MKVVYENIGQAIERVAEADTAAAAAGGRRVKHVVVTDVEHDELQRQFWHVSAAHAPPDQIMSIFGIIVLREDQV